MLTLPGYRIARELPSRGGVARYDGRRTVDGVAVEILAAEAGSGEAAHLANEHAVATRLRGQGIVPVHACETHGGKIVLVRGANGCRPLADAVAGGALPLLSALRVVAATARALDGLHRQQVAHLGLSPETILVDHSGEQVRLTGFGLATELDADGTARPGGAAATANPAYMAPEQTGRTGSDIGIAADLYALGIVLFQALTGELPFRVTDPLEWVHCHIAREPLSPRALDPALPDGVAAIVGKLLAKTPEERYRSAAGLAWDLLDCARRLQDNAGWDGFRVGERDSAPLLAIPARLFGREHDRDTLFAACRQALAGDTALLLVAGPAGIGKSALIQEMQPLFVRGGGHFVFGKFDERNRGTPYSSLIQALQELVHQVLAESDERLDHWRTKLTAALGANARLIVDVLRQAELVLGPQPPLPDLPPAETKVRFQTCLRDFICAFAEDQRPLAIFLDDLHWADTASLDLLQHLLADRQARHLLIVGAYRDNEVDVDHPLHVTLQRLAAADVPVNTLFLAPLGTGAVADLVAATLRTPGAEELGRLIADRTDGNPLFVRQFLLNLRDQNLLAYDSDLACWRWDGERIATAALPDNIADLMARRLQRLSAGATRTLRIAACIGSRFHAATVAAVAGCPVGELAAGLAEAEREGLIAGLGEHGRYRFCHDRIQQVAYVSLGDAERRTLHLAAGRALLEDLDANAESVFDIANQFQHGIAEIVDPAERLRLAAVFAQAGGRAKAAAATEASCAYLKAGAELGGEELWQADAALAMRLLSDLAECEFLSGRIEVAEPMFARILEHASEPGDIARLHALRMHLHMSRNRADLAVTTACEGLRRLGVALSPQPGKTALLLELARIAFALSGRRIEDLADLPRMDDPRQQAVMSIYMNLTVAAYFVNRDLLALVAMRMVALSIRHGNTGASAYAYVTFGMVVGGGFGRLRDGFRFGELGRRVGEASGDPRYQGLSLAMCGIFTGAWGQPLAVSLDQLHRAYRYLLDCGNLMMVNYDVIATTFIGDGMGKPLGAVAAEAQRHLDLVRKIRFDDSAHYFISVLRKIACLRGETAGPGDFGGAGYDEGAHLAALRVSTERTALAWHLVNRLQVAYLFGDIDAAKADVDELETLNEVSLAQLYVPRQLFYAALTELWLAAHKAGGERRGHLRAADRYHRRLAAFARNAPANFRHLEYLVAAERATLVTGNGSAMRLYEAALRSAADSGCNHDWALANERFGSYFLARGLESAAGPYLRDACSGYRQWGAEGLALALERRHPRLLAATDGEHLSLDMAAVIKAAQALSGEIEFAGLRRRFMESLAAHAGAARVLLILKRDSSLLIEDEWRAGLEMPSAAAQAFEQRPDLAHSVVQYAARTQADVVIDDAAHDHAFTHDAYLAAGGQKSVLCLPIVRHGTLLGLIYMENPLLRGAFHPQRLRVLHVLVSQLAISIENAGLYERLKRALENLESANRGLEDKVAERTRELSDEIAERKSIEVALLDARNAAEAANRAKSTFLANMSHEIRTPMNAIIGLSQLALRTELTPRQFGYVKKIVGAAEMLLGLINDILDMAKIEAGKMTLENVDFALDDVLDRVADTIEMAAHEKGLEFVVDRARDIPCKLVGDPLRLGQVLLNLASNAVKFTARGEVAMSAERILYDEAAGALVLRFAVRDTGVGLSAEQLARLFSPFSQADMSTTRIHGGTGLGLSIVKQLVEFMGGSVDVESAPGAGSTFAFTARFGIATPERDIQAQMPDYSLLRVLIVDDNDSARQALRHILEMAGCVVTAVADGDQALRELHAAAGRAAPFQLVLMDWNMPGMDGIEATRRIKSDPHIPSRPVVVMVTAFSREEVAQKAERENARIDGYLMKPVKPGVLYQTIAGLFGLAAPANEPQPAEDNAAALAAHLAGRRILVVEDNEYNQLVARELLEGAGLIVDITDNGRAGVDAVMHAEVPYDLVLMDIQMPVMDGWAATRELRETEAGSFLPIVGMTAYTMAEDIQRCHDAGMDEVITKPVRIDKVLEVLAARLRPKTQKVSPAATGKATANLAALARTPAPPTAPPETPARRMNEAAALSRLGGNRNLMLRLARDFVSGETGCAAKLERLVAEAQFEDAERLAHSTKGTALILGLERLAASAAEIERKLRMRDPAGFAAQLPEFVAELEAGIEALRSLIAAETGAEGRTVTPDRPPAPQGDWPTARAELAAMLARNDMASLGQAVKLRAAAGSSAQAAAAAELQALIEKLDFKGARQRLSELP